MAKKTVKLADIVNLPRPVDVNDDEQIMVRALTLKEMVTLLLESSETFMPLYAAGLAESLTPEALGPFLITAPELVAKIIALASDEPDQIEATSKLPATVQLVALVEIWKASVPDPKKAKELLSEVMAQLQKLNEKFGNKLPETPSPTLSLEPSIS
jgi:hypothetical protein